MTQTEFTRDHVAAIDHIRRWLVEEDLIRHDLEEYHKAQAGLNELRDILNYQLDMREGLDRPQKLAETAGVSG